jgi:outer membrane protein assembly factor BamB
MTVKVIKPDGTTQTLGPFTSDATGGTYTTFTPDQLGNYTFQMSFGGQTLANSNPQPGTATNAFVGDYFMPSTSSTVTLLVQSEPIPSIPTNPLPTQYWTRPIEAVNTLWYSLSGNWLGLGNEVFSANTGLYSVSGNYNPYSSSPKTAHILWSKPVGFGGLIGGQFGLSDTSVYMSTSVYEPKFAPIIINGVLYYTLFSGSASNANGFTAVDLRTGQTLWTNTPPIGNSSTLLKYGQTLDFVSPNQYGAIAYLWTTGVPPEISTDQIITAQADSGTSESYTTKYAPISVTGTTYNMYDAATGKYILSVVNGTGMTMTTDASGSLIGYYVNASTANAYNAPTLNCWNSTQAIMYPAGRPAGANFWEWRPPQNTVVPFSAGIMWSQPVATNISGVPLPSTLAAPAQSTGSGMTVLDQDSGVIVLMASASASSSFQTGYQIEAGYSLTTGQQLWITNRTEVPYSRITMGPANSGVYTEIATSTGGMVGYSITTGAQIWSKTLATTSGGAPNAYDSSGGYYTQVANGTLFINALGGDIWAYDIKTGNMLWYTNTNTLQGPAGTATPYGIWPIWSFNNPGAIADGVLFLAEGHEYSPPMFNGARQLAINTTNGQPVWSIKGFDVNGGTAVADGITVVHNGYDNQLYAYGMGPSKTTVTAPASGVTTAAPVTISGSVTDISAGALQQAVAANFPNGLPCMSDASMTQWMESVYMQQPMPANATGVPVTISVTDANGNNRVIGSTITNANGFFSFNWIPDIPGGFTITATFAGTQSYYGSSANSAFYASSIATTAPTSAPIAGYATTNDLMLGIAVIAVIIIIIGVVLAILLLRKRP